MDFKKIEELLAGEPKFRLKQARQAIFRDLIESWERVSALPVLLRRKLSGRCPLEIKAKVFVSKDEKTAKAVLTLGDGLAVETVLMRYQDRNAVCVSSQVGCPLGCVFCATGQMGFKRNLTVWEIAEQVLFFARYLKKEGQRVDSLVFMGMGEPFLNYENVLAAIKILNNKDGLNIGARHISISTAGIVEGIDKLAQEPLQINLAISLHASDDQLRSRLMPINKKYPLVKILAAIDKYIFKTRRKVMFEYIMIKDINDSEECARRLAKIAGQPLCFVNLISYNPTGIFSPSSEERIKKFKKILEKKGVAATRRFRFGDDIQAACGQLIPHPKK
jgi:23S rRNA (adenine2503-C2)-methyltransferase